MGKLQDLLKQNKGFSLIEVIVIVLILGIVSTVTVLGVGYAYGSSANKTANKLSSLLDLTRTQSMAMVEGSLVLRLSKETNGSTYAITLQTNTIDGITTTQELSREELCNSGLSVFLHTGGIETELTTDAFVDLSFKKNTGALLGGVTQIRLQGSKTAFVIIVKETGRNYVK